MWAWRSSGKAFWQQHPEPGNTFDLLILLLERILKRSLIIHVKTQERERRSKLPSAKHVSCDQAFRNGLEMA